MGLHAVKMLSKKKKKIGHITSHRQSKELDYSVEIYKLNAKSILSVEICSCSVIVQISYDLRSLSYREDARFYMT